MHYQTVRCNRKELYEQVWSIPMSRLSERYGLSDVGLAKICKKHDIPRPPRGYWAEKEAGQEPKRTPLPSGDPDLLIEIRPNPYNTSHSKLKTSTMAEISSEKEPERRIVVPETLEKEARIMYRARFSIASSSLGYILGPQKTLNPECRQVMSMPRSWEKKGNFSANGCLTFSVH